jgi:hypothetical protein
VALDVRLSAQAAEDLDALTVQRRGRLIITMLRVVARSDRRGLVNLWTPRDVAACEVLPAEGVLLVYALLERLELERRLFGAEIVRRAVAIEGRRFARRAIS